FRHAPGLSLAFIGKFPPQTALFVDGATAGAATEWRGDTATLGFLSWMPSASPYARGETIRSVLVLGSGDGLEVLAALTQGAHSITAVELNEPLTRLADSVLSPASRVYSDPRVNLVVGDARTYVARSIRTYDLVILPIAGEFSLVSSIHGLGEDYLNTVEAYAGYLGRLAPGGVLAITRWVDTPPRDATKALLTAAAALRRRGIDDVGPAMIFLRSWAAATLLVKPDGFNDAEVKRLSRFARERLFDIDWPAGGAPHGAHRDSLGGAPDIGPLPQPTVPHDRSDFNLIGRPVFAEAARAAALGADDAHEFARTYPFDVAPATDDRPYFGRFLRVRSIPAMLAEPRGSWLPFAEWGYFALLVTLLQSAAIAALLILVPALALTRGRRSVSRRDSGSDTAPDGLPVGRMVRVGVYFGAIGAAYLFVEIAVIQKLTLLLGHPVYAASAVLALFLALSGAGSLGSDRLPPTSASRAAAAVAIAAVAIALVLDLTPNLQPLAFPERLTAAFLLLAPLAMLMGMPFPLGLRRHAPDHSALAWAWAVNGFASVIAASLAAIISMEVGTRALLLIGAALYLAAAAISARPPFASANE
ncbi:MAG: spermidine synthase, partial [Longimicrobiales bacterium]